MNLGGQLHALEPLKYAFNRDQILMLDDPVVCMGALWIPYRRDKLFMKAILEDAWNRTDISVIFCHADVQGAWMNDNIQSREGLDVSSFPPNLPIFSGHFHKPHLVSQHFYLNSRNYFISTFSFISIDRKKKSFIKVIYTLNIS